MAGRPPVAVAERRDAVVEETVHAIEDALFLERARRLYERLRFLIAAEYLVEANRVVEALDAAAERRSRQIGAAA